MARGRRRAASAALILAGLAIPLASRAECDPTPDIGTCVTSDLLWPRPGPHRFAFLANAEPTEPGSFDLGLFSTYQRTPIVLRVPTPGPPGSDTYPVENQLSSTFVAAFGVHRHLALFAAFPWTSYQSGTGNSGLTGGKGLPAATLRDPRVGLAVPLLRSTAERPFAVALLFDAQLPTGSTSDFAGERGVVFAPSIVGQWRFAQRFRLAAEIDGRIRPVSRTFVGERQGTQLLGALGASADVVPEIFAAGLEARAIVGFSARSGENVVGGEWLAFLRSSFPGPFGVLVGGGGGLPFDELLGVPTARFLLAVDYSSGTTNRPGTPPTTPPTTPATDTAGNARAIEPAPPPAPPTSAQPAAPPTAMPFDDPYPEAPTPPAPEPPPQASSSAATCPLRCKADAAAPLTAKEEGALTSRVQPWFEDLRACFQGATRPSVVIRFGKGGVLGDAKIDERGEANCVAAQRKRLPRLNASHRAVVRCEEACP